MQIGLKGRTVSVEPHRIEWEIEAQWYVNVDNCIITVNAYSYTIITAHKKKEIF